MNKNGDGVEYKIICKEKPTYKGCSVLTAYRDGWYEFTYGTISRNFTLRKKLKKGQSVNLDELLKEENENEI